jgi:cytochrome c biogenesis protein CcdA
MLDNLGITISSICLLLGAAVLYVGVSNPDTNQILTVLSGAALLSLGLITFLIVLKNKLEWRRNYKKYREE